MQMRLLDTGEDIKPPYGFLTGSLEGAERETCAKEQIFLTFESLRRLRFLQSRHCCSTFGQVHTLPSVLSAQSRAFVLERNTQRSGGRQCGRSGSVSL